MEEQKFHYNFNDLKNAFADATHEDIGVAIRRAFNRAAREDAAPTVVNLTLVSSGLVSFAGLMGTFGYYIKPLAETMYPAAEATLFCSALVLTAAQVYRSNPPSIWRQFGNDGSVRVDAKGLSPEAFHKAISYVPDELCSPSYPPKNRPAPRRFGFLR